MEVEKRPSNAAAPEAEAEGFLKAVWNLASDSLHNSPTSGAGAQQVFQLPRAYFTLFAI
jgi:hypothetical protein